MPAPTTPEKLGAYWRNMGAIFARYGATDGSAMLVQCAVELELALAAKADAILTLDEAAAECAYSADHIGRLVRAGTIPNAGRPNAPRVRRGDLPPRRAPARPGASPSASARTASIGQRAVR